MGPAVEAVAQAVEAVAQVVAVGAQAVARLAAAGLPVVLLLEGVEARAGLAHKLVWPQVAVVMAQRRVGLPPEAQVAVLLLAQGLAASESPGRR